MTDAIQLSIRITRLDDRPGFVADVERDEPWWATADGYGATPAEAAIEAVKALTDVPAAEYPAVES